MPLHEYRCSECQRRTERLVRPGESLDPEARCSTVRGGCPGVFMRVLSAPSLPADGTYSYRSA